MPEPARGHGHGHASVARISAIGRAWHRFRHLLVPHRHEPSDVLDAELETSRRGMRALCISFALLLLTAVVQAVLVGFTGSVALLGDTVHNLADALTAVPLAIAFLLGRRAATRRFTYGFGRAEDIAGLLILAVIASSAALAGWWALARLLHPQPLDHLPWLAAAGAVGFVGNEWVARYRIRVGREIGSAALVADGLHARTDGLTSLAVIASAGGAAVGWHWVDPVVGLGITVAILVVLASSARQVVSRMLDAVDPDLVSAAEHSLRGVDGVHRVRSVRMRWTGHDLNAEAEVSVDPGLSVGAGHRIAHAAEHQLLHSLPRLRSAVIHVQPAARDADLVHDLVAHHGSATSG